MLSIVLTIVSAILMHIGVRNTQKRNRIKLVAASTALLLIGFSVSTLPGGIWSSMYTLMALFFVTCMLTPWFTLFWSLRRGT